MTTLSLFEQAGVEVAEPEPTTEVRLGHHSVQTPLRRKRREALEKLIEVLEKLEGKDVYIGTYGGAQSHFWINCLKLGRLRLGYSPYKYPTAPWKGDYTPSVVVLWGNREGSVRIFTDQLVDVREQECFGYTMWLVDFWNGFGEYPINPYRPEGSVSLEIVRFKD